MGDASSLNARRQGNSVYWECKDDLPLDVLKPKVDRCISLYSMALNLAANDDDRSAAYKNLGKIYQLYGRALDKATMCAMIEAADNFTSAVTLGCMAEKDREWMEGVMEDEDTCKRWQDGHSRKQKRATSPIRSAAAAEQGFSSVEGYVARAQMEEPLCCPISSEPMVDAVLVEDGHTYSRKAIQDWFDTGARTSPMTNLAIGTSLQSNRTVCHMVSTVFANLKL